MGVLLRIVAVICVLIAAFLIYAVIHAFTTAGGVNVPVCIGYIIGAIILFGLAGLAWRRAGRPRAAV